MKGKNASSLSFTAHNLVLFCSDKLSDCHIYPVESPFYELLYYDVFGVEMRLPTNHHTGVGPRTVWDPESEWPALA